MVCVDTDRILVLRALGRDRRASRMLALRLYPSIDREVGLALVRRPASALGQCRQDLVQDVMLHLFECDGRELRRWEPDRGRTLDSFVRLLARRRVARRLGQRRGNPTLPMCSLRPSSLASELDVRIAERDELSALLRHLRLRPGSRDERLFVLLFCAELEIHEVARALGMTTGAVVAWRYRVRCHARGVRGTDARDAA